MRFTAMLMYLGGKNPSPEEKEASPASPWLQVSWMMSRKVLGLPVRARWQGALKKLFKSSTHWHIRTLGFAGPIWNRFSSAVPEMFNDLFFAPET